MIEAWIYMHEWYSRLLDNKRSLTPFTIQAGVSKRMDQWEWDFFYQLDRASNYSVSKYHVATCIFAIIEEETQN